MISIIVAVAQNGVIGAAGRLLWHISEDLKRFKAITMGHPVVMGRKTFESLGCRPLPGRENVVITRHRDYLIGHGERSSRRASQALAVPFSATASSEVAAQSDNVRTAGSLREAFDMFPPEQEIFVIGGGQIYEQTLPFADKVYLTVVENDYAGDTRFPLVLDPAKWQVVAEQRFERGETFPYPFRYVDYVRR